MTTDRRPSGRVTARVVAWAAALWADTDSDLAEIYAEEWAAVLASAPNWRRPFVAAGFVAGAIWQSRETVLRRAAARVKSAGHRRPAKPAAPGPGGQPRVAGMRSGSSASPHGDRSPKPMINQRAPGVPD
jgi:hypothetical protein